MAATIPSRFVKAFQAAAFVAAAGGLAAAGAGVLHELEPSQLPAKLGLAAWLTGVGYLLLAVGALVGPWRPKERVRVA